MAAFPPRCVACEQVLAARPRFALCEPCLAVVEPNIGPRCRQCDVPGQGQTGSCPRCRRDPPAFSALRAPYLYGGPLADVITAAKFSRREDCAGALAEFLVEGEFDDLLKDAAAIVPVPLGRRRRWTRGYNQSAVLARALARHTGVPLLHGLRRGRETKAQSDLGLNDRRANVQGAFVPRRAMASVGADAKVVVVDDVVTSGHTVRAAAEAVLRAGVGEVVVVALARTEE